MRALLALLLAGLLAAAVPARAQEITFYYPIAVGGPLTKVIDGYARDFEKEHPGVKINPIYAGNYDDARIKALAALKAGQSAQISVLYSIDLYELRELRPEMKEIVTLISEAAAVTAEAVPLLRNVSGNGAKLHQLTGRLVTLEDEADDIHAAGLKRAFQEVARTSSLDFAVAREVFKNLERVTDAFEDVANQIDGIVIDHA